jgi:hypothetical protein
MFNLFFYRFSFKYSVRKYFILHHLGIFSPQAEINHFAKNPGALKDLIDRY